MPELPEDVLMFINVHPRELDDEQLYAPDSPLAPEVKLLVGSLHIREESYGPATDQFTKTREDYEPIHKQLADEAITFEEFEERKADLMARLPID